VYKDAAGSSHVTLRRGDCVVRFTHTYGIETGQMDAVTFVPITPPVLTALDIATER
jgi:hypothetical protein